MKELEEARKEIEREKRHIQLQLEVPSYWENKRTSVKPDVRTIDVTGTKKALFEKLLNVRGEWKYVLRVCVCVMCVYMCACES